MEDVIDLLECGSEQNALAVMLHGFGGMGKTTLAEAVFSVIDIEEYKYSMVQLFKNVGSTPDIIELQRSILKDLMGSEIMIPDIRKYQDGQRALGRVLEQVPALIYIDNVLGEDELQQLLPNNMNKAKKLRLLLTARDLKVRKGIRKIRTEVYSMKGLPDTAAMLLLEKEMYSPGDDKEEEIDSSQLNQIVKVCGGIPKLLEVVAGFMRSEEGPQKAYHTLMKEKEKMERFENRGYRHLLLCL